MEVPLKCNKASRNFAERLFTTIAWKNRTVNRIRVINDCDCFFMVIK